MKILKMKKKSATSPNYGEISEIGERIRQIRTVFFGGDTEKIAQVAGIHYTNIAKLINGDTKCSMKVAQNLLIAIPELSADWLILGNGTMRRGENATSATTPQPASNDAQIRLLRDILREKDNNIADLNRQLAQLQIQLLQEKEKVSSPLASTTMASISK